MFPNIILIWGFVRFKRTVHLLAMFTGSELSKLAEFTYFDSCSLHFHINR
jgi:hypothetical protein